MPSPFLLCSVLVQAPVSVWTRDEVASAVARPLVGVAVLFLLFQLVRRVPWPRRFNLRFLAVHALAAPALATLWGVLSAAIVALAMGESVPAYVADHWKESLAIGGFMYLLMAGIFYAVEGNARVARAEAAAARTQLAALRAQVHPHFLFNALHAVVQLIPVDPTRAAEAAELVAELLRTTLEEQRDEVTLADEWRFVSRYLDVERIRFGDRLQVRADLADAMLGERVPAFALQTLAENAVQHGAAPRVAPTEIVISASMSAASLTLSVWNSADAGVAPLRPAGSTSAGTGLPRLRERLTVLYGGAARLECRPAANGGYESILVLPRQRRAAA